MDSNTADSALSNPAVSRCWEAATAARQAKIAEGKDEDSAQGSANLAYRAALPPLRGVRHIRNFIACVTYGSLMGVIDGRESSRLLYAAQVAYSTRRTRKNSGKSAATSQEMSHSGAIPDGFCANEEPFTPPDLNGLVEYMKRVSRRSRRVSS